MKNTFGVREFLSKMSREGALGVSRKGERQVISF